MKQMKSMKRIRLWGLSACLLVGLTVGCGAVKPTAGSAEQTDAGSAAAVQAAVEHGPTVKIDGTKMQTDSVLQNKTVMVSAQEFAALMNAEYSYKKKKGTITLVWNDRTALLYIDKSNAVLNGKETDLEAPFAAEDTVYIPVKAVAKAFAADARTYHKTLYVTSYAGEWTVPEGYSVPVLMYHAVGDDLWGEAELFVSPSNLEEQLAYLKENGYTTITFEDLYRIDEIEKPVMLTFDDGYDDNYEYLYPLLQKYDSKATVFVISCGIGSKKTHKMTAKQLREMSDSGLVSVQSHAYSHEQLGTLSRRDQEAEMKRSSRTLLECTGKYPFVLCYPHGSYNEDTLDVGKKYHHFGIKINGGLYHTGDNPLLVSRYYISRYTDLSTFASYIQS